MIEFFDLTRSHYPLRSRFHEVLDALLDSSEYVLGSNVVDFEGQFANYCKTQFAVATNSGTSALHLALEACGVSAGDEVITTPMTFIATASSISYLGAIPVFVDVDPQTWTIDVKKIEAAITPRTKVILPVHLHGVMANMPAVMEIAKKYKLSVVEDAAQAHGASINGLHPGQFGDIACFSFYPGKNLGALGEAGAIVTNNALLAERVRLMRNWGALIKYEHSVVAYNYRMDGIQGGFLSVKLPYMSAWNKERAEIANKYSAAFTEAGIQCPHVPSGFEHVFHVYAIVSQDKRNLATRFSQQKIGFGAHYPIPVHLQEAYSSLGYKNGSFPVSERLAQGFFSLPIYPGLSDEEVSLVIQAVLDSERPR